MPSYTTLIAFKLDFYLQSQPRPDILSSVRFALGSLTLEQVP